VKDFETTEVPSIEFIGYRIPQHEQNNCKVSVIHKTLKRPRFRLLNLSGIVYHNTSKITTQCYSQDFETTEVPSIEFIGYRIPQHEQNNYTVLFTRHQSTKA